MKKIFAFLRSAPRWQQLAMGGILAALIIVPVVCSIRAGSGTVLKLAAVSRGSLRSEITASGALQPDTSVQVGTQVSGTITRLFADYNSRVRKGQLIAQLDTTFLAAAVDDATSSLQKAEADLALSASAKKRAESLYTQQLISQADEETALAQYQGTLAARNSAQAQLLRARINLNYASIRSPMNGIVISRSVEVGQTVAASMNTPTLFIISDDLRRMQVSADIDEGDIGKVAVGQRVSFTVDAYPDRIFDGGVSKIYLQPTTVQNVVSYTTIIDAPNPDLKLMPGMTANVTVIIQEAADALLVPAGALNFQPAIEKKPRTTVRPDSARNKRAAAVAGQSPVSGRPPGAASGGQRAVADSAGRGPRQWGNGGNRIYVFKDKKLQRVPVQVLLNNGISAAVVGEVAEGDSVAVGYNSVSGKAKTAVNNPFQQQRPAGRRF